MSARPVGKEPRHHVTKSVQHYLASIRRGTASTKTRHEVAGSGKKLCNGRRPGPGSWWFSSAVHWRHGGTHADLTAQLCLQAAQEDAVGRVALSSFGEASLVSGVLRVADQFRRSPSLKSKGMRRTLDGLANQKTVLLVDNGDNQTSVCRAATGRRVKLVSGEVGIYDLLGHEQVLMSEAYRRAVRRPWHWRLSGTHHRHRASHRHRKRASPRKTTNGRAVNPVNGCEQLNSQRVQLLFKIKVEDVRTSPQAASCGGAANIAAIVRTGRKRAKLKADQKMPVRRFKRCRLRAIDPPSTRFTTVVSRADLTNKAPEKPP